jgi:hypothetical protein
MRRERGLAGLKRGRLGETGAWQLARRLRISYLAIEVNEFTGKARTLNHTKELDLHSPKCVTQLWPINGRYEADLHGKKSPEIGD